MRKTFIEARMAHRAIAWGVKSLPLMRKTFIEAAWQELLNKSAAEVSSAYAEDFH